MRLIPVFRIRTFTVVGLKQAPTNDELRDALTAIGGRDVEIESEVSLVIDAANEDDAIRRANGVLLTLNYPPVSIVEPVP
jgi:hypothetical protein